MSVEEKLSIYRQLKKIQYPSDQEISEMEQLEDEIKMIYNDLGENVKQYINNTKENDTSQQDDNVESKPKKYRGIISGRIEKWRERKKEKNKTTPEMLRQLELDARRAELEARIARAKKKKQDNKTNRLSNFHIPGKIFETSEDDDKRLRRALSSSSNEDDYKKLF